MNIRTPSGRFRPPFLLTALAAAVLVAACGGGDDDPEIDIRTPSTRADLVTGGDAFVEISLPADATASGLVVQLNGTDVTSAFARRADGRFTGVVTGLNDGANTLVASAPNAGAAQLVVTNSPRSGPVLSGAAHITPYYCATPTAVPASGNTPATAVSGLSGQPDANCSIATEVKYYYRTTADVASTANPGGCSTSIPDPSSGTPPANGCFKPYTAGSTPPDLAQTTDSTGATVPFIVRVERGTINRGIYDIAVLADPAKDWTATAPQATWNGKVVMNFGASTGQPRRQVRPASAWSTSHEQLAAGFMVVANSMTDSSRNSNRVLMAETAMMMKEHIGDTYGPITYTMGSGCSGGSIASNTIASIAPGVLDGVTTFCTYPDSETTSMEVGDCVLLVEAYQKPEWLALMGGLTQAQIDEKKGKINGHPDQSACHAWYNAFGSNGRPGVYFQRFVADAAGTIVQSPTATNNCELPNAAVYDPANPEATALLPRCGAWNWAQSIWGAPEGAPAGSNAARDTRDNVGVQYGLKALLDGDITAEEFVTLNEIVGGTDADAELAAERSVGDEQALATAYRAGIVTSGRQLAKTAIIDMRGWDDSSFIVPPGATAPGTPIHHVWYSFAVRDRLVAGYGDADNQALWRYARTNLTPPGSMAADAMATMDQWLTTLEADTSGAPIEEKVRAARPASSADFCLLPEDATQSVKVTDPAVCDANPFLAPSLSPRQVAGGPRAEDVLKCQLKPLQRSDYAAVTFTEPQWTRLQAAFPDGVCDWSKPGVGQQDAVSWLSFKAGPGGQPLPEAPRATGR